MTILLAALDDSAACRPILEATTWVARLVGAEVVAVHVRENGSGETAREIAGSFDVPIVVRTGDVVAAICDAADDLHAGGIALGTRSTPGGASPAGHIAVAVAEQTTVPVMIVPPERVDRRVDRILIALEGNGDSEMILALAEQLRPASQPDIVAVHVFKPDALPPFGDDPTFEAEAWTHELLRRASNTVAAKVHLDIRVGDPAVRVSEAVRDLEADLVVLAWHRRFSEGHARIVRSVLESAHVPLILLNALPADNRVGAAEKGNTHGNA